MWILLMLAAAPEPIQDSHADPSSDVTDSDQDNVPDDVERRMGTSPTDSSDVPPIPEPLYIDLIRNLGSPRGELEVNTLAATRLRRDPVVAWGPEIEYVAFRNFAVELELPFADGRLEALKGGFQTRVVSVDRRTLEIGILAVGYHMLEARETILEPTALVAMHLSREVQLLAIVGPTAALPASGPVRGGAMFHPSLFYQASRVITFGLEMGHRTRETEGRSTYALPQVHVNVIPRVKLQVGAGVSVSRTENAELTPLLVTRLSYEY